MTSEASKKAKIKKRPVPDDVEGLQKELRRARAALQDVIRSQAAAGIAPLFFTKKRPWDADPLLSELFRDQLAGTSALPQKPPVLLRFYQRVLHLLEAPPRRILEIGVKGGGSLALWRALFPDALVVGADIKPPRMAPADKLVLVRADQSVASDLESLAAEHGPFDLVIDDGSHVPDHQVTTIRALLDHVVPGGLYLIEDVHSGAKDNIDRKFEYGPDQWREVVGLLFQAFTSGARSAWVSSSAKAPTELAQWLLPRVQHLVLSDQMLGFVKRDPEP